LQDNPILMNAACLGQKSLETTRLVQCGTRILPVANRFDKRHPFDVYTMTILYTLGIIHICILYILHIMYTLPI